MKDKLFWENRYKSKQLEQTPWELGKPDKRLTHFVKEKRIKGKDVLDVCCGWGTQSIYLAQKGFTVSAIDISKSAVTKAKERAKSEEVDIFFTSGNVQHLPFEDNSFDFIFDRGCLHHQYDTDMEQYLSQVKRVLRPKGNLFVIAFTSRFTMGEIENIFKTDYKIIEHSNFEESSNIGTLHGFHALFLEKK